MERIEPDAGAVRARRSRWELWLTADPRGKADKQLATNQENPGSNASTPSPSPVSIRLIRVIRVPQFPSTLNAIP
jgi:hypothetical protein